MATFSKKTLAYSLTGQAIKIADTSSPGTGLHYLASSSDIDELWLYATNTSASDVKLTIQFGGTTSPDDLIEYTVPAEKGLYLVVPGLILTGSAGTTRAFAATANVINVFGYVNRISP